MFFNQGKPINPNDAEFYARMPADMITRTEHSFAAEKETKSHERFYKALAVVAIISLLIVLVLVAVGYYPGAGNNTADTAVNDNTVSVSASAELNGQPLN